MPHPEGYRMAIRLMKEAERFGRPIITIIDTPGAYPGIGAEERGQGAAIADSLYAMSSLTVPVISLFSGEAGSGGALGIACADRLYMLEGAIYTILSPEALRRFYGKMPRGQRMQLWGCGQVLLTAMHLAFAMKYSRMI